MRTLTMWLILLGCYSPVLACDLPDLTISQLEVNVETVENDKTLLYSIIIENTGSVTLSDNVTIQAYLSNSNTLDGSEKGAGGATFPMTIEPNGTKKSGRHAGAQANYYLSDYRYLIVALDHNETIVECDDNNNTYVFDLTDTHAQSCQSVDLIVESLDTLAIKDNTAFQYNYILKNNGGRPLNNRVKVNFWFSENDIFGDDDDVDGGSVSQNLELAPGEAHEGTLDGESVDGLEVYSHLFLSLDEKKRISECDEDNNVFAMPMECQLPDVAITDFIIYQDDVKPTSLEYYYEVTNLGLADLGTSGVLERVGAQVYYSQDKVIDRNDQAGGGFMRGGTLAAGESYEFIAGSNTLSNSRLISNYKYLIFEIDIEGGKVAECDMSNNIIAYDLSYFTPGGPCDLGDIIVSNVTVYSGAVIDDQSLTYHLELKNVGVGTIEEDDIGVQAWYSNDKEIGDVAGSGWGLEGTMSPNGTLKASFGSDPITGNISDYKYLVIDINGGSIVEECDYENNSYFFDLATMTPGNPLVNSLNASESNFLSYTKLGNAITAKSEITIFSISGTVVTTLKRDESFNLNNGLYIFKILNNGEYLSEKILISN